MSHGFSPYSGDSYGSPGGTFASPGAGPTGFGATSTTRSGLSRATSAPVHCLLPSLILGVVAIVLNAFLTFGPVTATETTFAVLAFLAWGLAGIFGVTALAWYFNTDNQRRGAGFYTEIGWKKFMFAATAAVLVIAVLWSAIDIALWAGKL